MPSLDNKDIIRLAEMYNNGEIDYIKLSKLITLDNFANKLNEIQKSLYRAYEKVSRDKLQLKKDIINQEKILNKTSSNYKEQSLPKLYHIRLIKLNAHVCPYCGKNLLNSDALIAIYSLKNKNEIEKYINIKTKACAGCKQNFITADSFKTLPDNIQSKQIKTTDGNDDNKKNNNNLLNKPINVNIISKAEKPVCIPKKITPRVINQGKCIICNDKIFKSQLCKFHYSEDRYGTK